jgi:hypothetical protein
VTEVIKHTAAYLAVRDLRLSLRATYDYAHAATGAAKSWLQTVQSDPQGFDHADLMAAILDVVDAQQVELRAARECIAP